MFAEDEARLLLAQAAGEELETLVDRRVAGEPLEHVLGWVAFDGLRLAVAPGVFVPRRRTELMVAEAARRAEHRPDPVVVDLCCGCGAVGVAVLHRLGRGTLLASDVDPVAVRCAARNVALVGGRAFVGDLFEGLSSELQGRVDVLTANVPYVPTAAIGSMPPEARDHEPHVALDGGADGLAVLARLAASAARWLVPGGAVLVEVGDAQVPEAERLLAAGSLTPEVVTDEDLGATVMVGSKRVGTAPRGTESGM